MSKAESDKRTPKDKNIKFKNVLQHGGYYDINGNWNSIVQLLGYPNKVFRGRVEVLVVKDDKVYLVQNSHNYRIPGGSFDQKRSNIEQVFLEVKEEAKMYIKDIIYTGIDRIHLFSHILYNQPGKIHWDGTYSQIYIAEFSGYYNGEIREDLIDTNILSGNFYSYKDIKYMMYPEHRRALDMYFKYKNNSKI